MQGDELLPRQNFPLNLPPNRRLCSTGGERIVEGWTAHCCVASAARSRAATMTNLARSSLALILPALFGAAKSCALVKFSMICPHWSPSRRPTTNQIVLLITAISWHLCEHVEGESRGGRRMQIALRTIFIAAACRDRARRLVLPKGGSFLNHGQPCRRQFRSSSNDVSFPLKSYADWQLA